MGKMFFDMLRFGNMAYMLFCGLLCLRSKEHRRREGLHAAFEGERGKGANRNRQRGKHK